MIVYVLVDGGVTIVQPVRIFVAPRKRSLVWNELIVIELLVCETIVTPDAGVVYEIETELVQEIYIIIICYSQLPSCPRDGIGSSDSNSPIIIAGTDGAI